jgi:FkbM family methyltransferase
MLQTQFQREAPSVPQEIPSSKKPISPLKLSALLSHGEGNIVKSKNETEGCPLPFGGKWCEVRLEGLPSYKMAVYDSAVKPDVVSGEVCLNGFWEEKDMTAFGEPGHMLDIGGNLGYFTFAFAQAGWSVTTFEPMQPNYELITATLCQNPDLAQRIHLNTFGLGTASKTCKMMSPAANVGDGFVRCAGEEAIAPKMPDEDSFIEIGQFSIKRLDDILVEQNISKVDLVKIDVEGYEAQVFAGAPQFLAQYHPRVIRSEVWMRMVGDSDNVAQNSFDSLVGSSGAAFLDSFTNAGYKFFKDGRCAVPLDARQLLLQQGAVDLYMCL